MHNYNTVAVITAYQDKKGDDGQDSHPPESVEKGSILFKGAERIVYEASPDFDIGTGDFIVSWNQWQHFNPTFARVFSMGSYNHGGASFAVSIESGSIYLWCNGSLQLSLLL